MFRSWFCLGEVFLSGEVVCIVVLRSWRSVCWVVFFWFGIGREYGDCGVGMIRNDIGLKGFFFLV